MNWDQEERLEGREDGMGMKELKVGKDVIQ